MTYITTTDVSNELNGLTIDTSSTPSNTVVSDWIDQEQDSFERDTGKVWATQTNTDEYLDYDGSGHIRTNYAPIISVTKLEYDSAGLGSTSDWVEITEGREASNSFITYKPEGDIVLHNLSLSEGFQNIKITYTSGYASANGTVKKILAKMVAMRVISTVINGQTSEEGGSVTVGAISISDPSTFSLDRYRELDTEVNTLIGTLGSFKTYRYNRV